MMQRIAGIVRISGATPCVRGEQAPEPSRAGTQGPAPPPRNVGRPAHGGARVRARQLTPVALVFALALAAAVPALARPRPARLSMRTLQGRRASLKQLRGHIVVLNLWANWCGPCRAEMPLVAAAYRKFSPQGIRFVGISFDPKKTRGKIVPFLHRYGADYPIWLGGTADTLDRLKAGDAIPDTLVLDASGVIRFRILGEMRPGELAARLHWLLHTPGAVKPPAKVVHLGKKS